MTTLEFWQKLMSLKVPFIQTVDMAEISGLSVSSAGKYLETLRARQFVEKISRGKWVVLGAEFDPLQAAEFITAPQESYISLQTALFYHGMIEQIPTRVYAVTIDRSRTVKTPLGVYSFHHCQPLFFKGYDYIKPYLKIATPEKALIDYFYFAPSRSGQFTHLPELAISKKFSWKKALSFGEAIPSPRTRTLVLKNINDLSKGSMLNRPGRS